MVDAIAISGAITSLKACFEITKGIMELRDDATIKAKVTELLGEIASAQESALRSQERQYELIHKVQELEQRIADMETWGSEKDRYNLVDFGGGTFAYLLNPDLSNGEPSHRLCPHCFQKNEKSILQFVSKTVMSQDRYDCPSCKHEFSFGVSQEPPDDFYS